MKLDDASRFVRVLDLHVPWAHTWADMRPGKTDLERRENFRREAIKTFKPQAASAVDWWAFRIFVTKSGRQLDLDNIAKPIVDAFCSRQIARDESSFMELGLYPDDGIENVRHISLSGQPGAEDSTHIEIFGHLSGCK